MKQSKLSFGKQSPTKTATKTKEKDKKVVDPLQFFSKRVVQKPPVVLKKSSFFNDTELDNVLIAQGDVLENSVEAMDVSDENNPVVDVQAGKDTDVGQPKETVNADTKNAETQGVEAETQGVEAETQGVKEEPKKKFNYYAHKQKLAQMPKAHGSKEIPVGEENCLGGLAFVFTGELSSLSREEAIDLVKRYGARVVGAPSSKTSYVVVGEEAGASKLEKVKKLGLKTLDEDGLLDLIRVSKSRPEEVKKPVKKSPKKSPSKVQQETAQKSPESPKYTLESIKTGKVDVSSLSVKNIKEILVENNVSTAGLVEKSDLVSKVYSLVGKDATKTNSHVSIEMIREGKVEVNSLSVSSLKEILERNSVSTVGLLEKSDLQNAVNELALKTIHKKHKAFDVASGSVSKKPKLDHENVPKSVVDDQLWTVKYKPKSYSDIIGNKAILDKLSKWLREWHQNRLNDFKKRDDTSIWRAALLSGPPGIGKTTMAHLVAQTEGYDPLEFNASDVRSKKALENIVKEALGTKSMTEFFPVIGQGQAKSTKKTVIIMDEVDGMSAGDRGGSAELIRLIKKSKVPIICICNDRKSPKMRSLANSCLDLSLRRPTAQQVENRIKLIAQKEGLDLKPNVVGELVASTSADIRQILNILSTYRLSKTVMTYDQSKNLLMNAKKNITVGPFDVMSKIFSQSGFRSMSIPEKIEQYFHDYSLIPLMIQENYIRMSPSLAREASMNNPKQIGLETLSLISNAADAISLGDILDNSQRSANNWSLLPVHAVFSTVIPCFFTHGQMNGMFNFPSWLGQNSKSSKTLRLLREIATHTRINVSADKLEFRETYIPAFVSRMFDPLSRKGQEGINDVISFMDHYHITKDDFDSINEIFMNKLPDIPTAVKSAFTRTYNKMAHPTVSAYKSSNAGGRTDNSRPDFEDLLEDEAPEEEEEEEEEKLDDKMIKVSKKKEQKAKESSSKGKGFSEMKLAAEYDSLEKMVHKLVIQYGHTRKAIAENVDYPPQLVEEIKRDLEKVHYIIDDMELKLRDQ